MCGIVGVVSFQRSSLKSKNLRRGLVSLISGAERRGQDASGYIYTDKTLTLFSKFPTKLSNQKSLILKKRKPLGGLIHKNKSFALFLHSRMETHGTGSRPENNHPITLGDYLLLHNGIILNHKEIRAWTKNRGVSETDSETLLILMDGIKSLYPELTTADLFRWATSLAVGANTFILFDKKTKEYLVSSSNGSMHYYHTDEVLLFASEKLVVLRAVKAMFPNDSNPEIKQVGPRACLNLRIQDNSFEYCEMSTQQTIPELQSAVETKPQTRYLNVQKNEDVWLRMQRIIDARANKVICCNLCLLPKHYPGLSIDASGTCDLCDRAQTRGLVQINHKKEILDQTLDEFLELSGRNVLVPFSGGRDSSFLLHKLKVDLGLRVTAFTYDWGFVTNTARENISRMCGELKIEHLLISADIKKKRQNVALNVNAWLRRPHPGVIPLFMAGDKTFFRIATSLKREYQFDSVLFGMNRFEPASFKTASMGVQELPGNKKSTFGLSAHSAIQMALFYTLEFIKNPKMINLSIPDTVLGFYSYYLKRTDYINFFDYYPWELAEIESVLEHSYGWSSFSHPMNGWRNGDATAPFYNLLYSLLLGFNENHVLNANLLRAGQIDLVTAKKLLAEQQNIDILGVRDYFDLIGLDADLYFGQLISSEYFRRALIKSNSQL